MIILEYRDTGPYPFYIKPNILEDISPKTKNATCIFRAVFFQKNYFNAIRAYDNFLKNKLFLHDFRKNNFNVDHILSGIGDFKNMNEYNVDAWDIENAFDPKYDRENIQFIFKNGSTLSFFPSQLLIANAKNQDNYFIAKAADILEDIELYDNLEVQRLDDLYKDLKLFDKTTEEASEITELKKQYGLKENEYDSRLWKVLLKRRADRDGNEEVYSDLKMHFNKMGMDFIKEDYFINFWLNPKSKTFIPRQKKIFLKLCEYLDLPKTYYRVMLKNRAKLIIDQRKNNSTMNNLIIDLVERGYIDKNSKKKEFQEDEIESLFNDYDLEEFGFDENNLKNNFHVFIEWLKLSINLRSVREVNRL